MGAGGLVVLFILAIPAHQRVRREQDQHRQVRREVPRPRTAPRSASAASCTTTQCRSRRFPIISSRPRSPPRIDASSSTSASTSSAPPARCSRMRAPTRWCRAARPSASSSPRTCSCPRSARSTRKLKEVFLAFLLESRFTKRADPEALSRPRLSRRRRLRRRGRLPVLLRQVGARDQSGGSGADRRPVQGALALCPARQPAGLARAHQRCAHQPGRGRLHERRPGACRAAQSGQVHRYAAHPQPRLVPRLGLRGGAAPRRGPRPLRAHRTHHGRSRHAAVGAGRDDQHLALHRTEPKARLYRRHGVDGARRRRARAGRRHGLRGQPIQPRLPRPSPAGLLLQALRLRHRLRERLQPALDRARLRRRVRQLGAAQLQRRRPRAGR